MIARWLMVIGTVVRAAAFAEGCGASPPLSRTIAAVDVEGESVVAAIYRFAHQNDICAGLVLTDKRLASPVARRHFVNVSAARVLAELLPAGYHIFELGRVAMMEPAGSVPAWLSQRLPRFELEQPIAVQMALSALYTQYDWFVHPELRRQGVAGSVLGVDESNRVGPLAVRNRSMAELLSLIAERSRGAMWIGIDPPRWEFIEYQHTEERGVLMTRWVTACCVKGRYGFIGCECR